MFEPQPLTNNAVSSVIDFSALQETRASLTNKTVIVGAVTYTFFVDVFPESVDASTLLDPRDIAAALCDAINADATARGVTFSAALIPSANPQAEAYVSGSVVTVVSRTGAVVIIGGSSGAGTGGGGSSSVSAADDFDAITVLAAYSALPNFATAKSFSIDNLDANQTLSVRKGASGDSIIIAPRTGRLFSGNPALYQASASGVSLSAQLQIKY